MNVTVWNYDGYDIAAPRSGDPYNYFAVLDANRISIEEKPVTVGPVEFQPGTDYTKIGNGKKTSAGYFCLELSGGIALRYVGLANNDYLLFRKVVSGQLNIPGDRDLFGLIMGRYQDIYFAYRILGVGSELFWLTGAGAGRIIEL